MFFASAGKKIREKMLFCYEEGGKAVGLMGFTRSNGKSSHVIKLVTVGVLPAHRGRGIAGETYSLLEKHAKKIGAKRIELSVSEDVKTAIKNYKKWGFGIEGRKKKKWFCKGMYSDVIMMAKLFV